MVIVSMMSVVAMVVAIVHLAALEPIVIIVTFGGVVELLLSF